MLKDCCSSKDTGSSVTVKVDVTKIVRYVCVSAIFIVGIIFGTRCYHQILDNNHSMRK
jgi:hypothetical protein